MSMPPAAAALDDDWRQRIAGLPADIRIDLARRADAAPLLAHAYAFHLNFRFGGMTPLELAEFAHRHGLAGLKIHVSDGEGASLSAMSAEELSVFGRQVRGLGLDVHVETSTTSPDGPSDAVMRAQFMAYTTE